MYPFWKFIYNLEVDHKLRKPQTNPSRKQEMYLSKNKTEGKSSFEETQCDKVKACKKLF